MTKQDIVDQLRASMGHIPFCREAADRIEQLEAALKVARDCVLESFDYVKTIDDQVLADARLRDIDAALAHEQSAGEGGSSGSAQG